MIKTNASPLYHRHRFPPDVIAQADRLYFRFPLSLRMVEDLLAERGITVSHQTIRTWAKKFGRHFAANIRRRSTGQFADKWHLDEVVITIVGKTTYVHALPSRCSRTQEPIAVLSLRTKLNFGPTISCWERKDHLNQ